MKKKILLLISFACVIILAINDIYCSKHKNQEEDIIKIEKNIMKLYKMMICIIILLLVNV